MTPHTFTASTWYLSTQITNVGAFLFDRLLGSDVVEMDLEQFYKTEEGEGAWV